MLEQLSSRSNRNQSELQQDEENEVDPDQLTMSRIYRTLFYTRALNSRRSQLRRGTGRDSDDNDEDDDILQNEIDSDEEYSSQPLSSNATSIILKYDLPQQWREIEEDNSAILLEIFKMMGPLAVLLYKRIEGLKIITNPGAGVHQFLKQVIDYYETNSKKITTDQQSLNNVKQLMGIVPNEKQLRKGMKYREQKENIIYKLVFDVMGHYLKENESFYKKVRFEKII